jgi:hypothetical protein
MTGVIIPFIVERKFYVDKLKVVKYLESNII